MSGMVNPVQGDKDGNAGEAQFSFDTRDIIVDKQGSLYFPDQNRIYKISPLKNSVSSILAESCAKTNCYL
jgi:hypothetical protein